MPELFDKELRALRRDRAARTGSELFLHERAFDDCVDRLSLIHQHFDRALLIGCPDPDWPERLREFVRDVDMRDPGPIFAQRAGGDIIVEDEWVPDPGSYNLVVAVGTLDTVNDLPRALMTIRFAMQSAAFFLGALSGGDTLPRLRAAMRAADLVTGAASPHVHPRVEASALAPLLEAAGFVDPVVDVDRVGVSYPSLERLIQDLRRIGATNMLTERPRLPLSRWAAEAARKNFAEAGKDGKTLETFEIVHFACWTPAS